jgi:hypothetical protein
MSRFRQYSMGSSDNGCVFMDTKKLVVGQKVWMQSGDQFKEATVEEITENYVRVFIAPTGPFTKWLPKDGRCEKSAILLSSWA